MHSRSDRSSAAVPSSAALRAVSAVALVFALLPAASGAQAPPMPAGAQVPRPMIITTATEEVEIAPDRAMLTFSVQTRAKTAAAAGADNAQIQAAVLDTLRRLGIAAPQLRTRGLWINPEYEYPKDGGRPTVIGYQAQNSVQVEIRQLPLVGAVIDAGLAKGATNVGSLQFFASSTEAAGRDALRKAVARARADAEAVAEAADGRIVGVSEITVLSGSSGGPMPEFANTMSVRSAQRESVPTPIETGSLKVSVSIEAKFFFAPR